jgi:nitrous oxidase accessory protein NosD
MGVGVLLVVLGAIPASAAPCHVPSSAYPTIQAAVNDPSSPPCATINVAAGTYIEGVVIQRDVTIRGEGQESTIVDGNQSGGMFRIDNGTVTIKGVTIQNGFLGIQRRRHLQPWHAHCPEQHHFQQWCVLH